MIRTGASMSSRTPSRVTSLSRAFAVSWSGALTMRAKPSWSTGWNESKPDME
jgi:hypothetical protein